MYVLDVFIESVRMKIDVLDLIKRFSLTWPAAMQLYRNKRKFLHKEGLTPTELVSLGMTNMTTVAFLGHQHCGRDVMWKRSIGFHVALMKGVATSNSTSTHLLFNALASKRGW